jgi:hypothetical protein
MGALVTSIPLPAYTGRPRADDRNCINGILYVLDSSTVAAKKGGQQIGFDGHKKTKGSKIHVAVTPQCLPIAIDVGSGNEHESRKLIPLLNDIQITNNNGRPKNKPERVWADTKYHTFLVLTDLYNRRIRAQIKERRNTKSTLPRI